MYVTFSPASEKDIPLIQSLAQKIWPKAFENILSSAQIEYMMEMMYSDDSLKKQLIESRHQFMIISQKEMPLGYISYEHNFSNSQKTKVHKIYLDIAYRNAGIGAQTLLEIESLAKHRQEKSILLDVNRYNTAINFYIKQGFTKIQEEEIDIGHGYIMDNWVMEKLIS